MTKSAGEQKRNISFASGGRHLSVPAGGLVIDRPNQVWATEEFTGVLKRQNIRISTDGKGRCVDNVFVERLWRSVKYKEVCLRAYDSIASARALLGQYFTFYNAERRHQSLDRRTPDSVHYEAAARLAA